MNKTVINQVSRHTQGGSVLAVDKNILMGVIDVNKIYINEDHPHRFPRTNKERVKQIADNWDIKKAGAINVFFHPDGPNRVFALGNGNHRFDAAQLKDIQYLPATIVVNIQAEEECDTVKGWNAQRAFTATDNFRADVKSGNPFAIKIMEIVTRNKFRIDVSKQSMSKIEQTNTNTLKCYRMLQDIARTDFELLDRTLKTIYKCNRVEGTRKGVVEKEALKDNYIFAVAQAIKACKGDRFKIGRIEDVLLNHEGGAAGVIEQATQEFDMVSSGNRGPALRKYILRQANVVEEEEVETEVAA